MGDCQRRTETGVTIMKMDAGLDTGPILSMRRTPILPTDDSQTLHDRLAQLGAELLVETIPDYVAGKIQPQPQPTAGASLRAKIKKEDGRIDWKPAEKSGTGCAPSRRGPGAFTAVERNGTAGTVISADKTGIVVGCGQGALRLLELQREGGKRMAAEQFLAGHPIKPGERFLM
jgi:methionyl-tRNA formyltransferase